MKQIIYFFLVIAVVSCTSNTIYEKPKDLIPKDSMILLMQDMYIATSAKNIKNIALKTKVDYMPLVYDKFKIDSLRFAHSNLYYTSKLEVYSEIVEQVKKNLDTLTKQYELKVRIMDSLKREETMKNTPKKIKKDGEAFLEKNSNKDLKLPDSLLKETIKSTGKKKLLPKAAQQ